VNADELRARAHEIARALPGSQFDRPFGPDWDVYRVRGRIFALLTETTGPQMLTLKADPQDGAALGGVGQVGQEGQDAEEGRHGLHLLPSGRAQEFVEALAAGVGDGQGPAGASARAGARGAGDQAGPFQAGQGGKAVGPGALTVDGVQRLSSDGSAPASHPGRGL